MATMYAPGARRSAAPRYSPRAALTSEALYDDQVTKDLLDAMLSAVQPAGVGQSQAGVNLGEVLGSGTSIADFDFGGGLGGLEGVSSGPGASGGTAGLGTVADIGKGFSALGVLGQDPNMAQLGQIMGQVATVGTAASQAAQGNLGQAAMTVGPAVAQAMGIPGGLVSIGMTAANPALGPVDTQASIVNAAIAANPAAFAAMTLAQLFGAIPSTKSMLTLVDTIDVNAMIAEQEAMQAMMEEAAAIAQGFDSAVTDSTVGITGAEAGSADSGGVGEGASVGSDGPGSAGDAGPGSGGGSDGGDGGDGGW